MTLATIPLVFALIGLALYTVLGGSDFGAGMWQLTAGGGPTAARLRDHAHVPGPRLQPQSHRDGKVKRACVQDCHR